jgi:hypothetical protein
MADSVREGDGRPQRVVASWRCGLRREHPTAERIYDRVRRVLSISLALFTEPAAVVQEGRSGR